jgi:hypothetical protein
MPQRTTTSDIDMHPCTFEIYTDFAKGVHDTVHRCFRMPPARRHCIEVHKRVVKRGSHQFDKQELPRHIFPSARAPGFSMACIWPSSFSRIQDIPSMRLLQKSSTNRYGDLELARLDVVWERERRTAHMTGKSSNLRVTNVRAEKLCWRTGYGRGAC